MSFFFGRDFGLIFLIPKIVVARGRNLLKIVKFWSNFAYNFGINFKIVPSKL